MTKEQREQLEHLKREISQAKGRLIDVCRSIEKISPAQGEKLSRILLRLEAFQNSK